MRSILVPAIMMLGIAASGFSQDRGVTVLETRPGVHVSLYWATQPNALRTLVLFPGGEGEISIKAGVPTSKNFLVRSLDEFLRFPVDVVVMDRPSDFSLTRQARTSSQHLDDVRKVIEFVSQKFVNHIWLVGTSNGTVSVAFVAGQKLPGSLEGIVLTSSIVAPAERFSVPRQNLGGISVPVLLIQHQKDACRFCSPSLLPGVLPLFTSSPVKKLILATGGSNPRGDPCGPLHWHGFIGMESEAVGLICNWINSPEA